MVIDEKAEKKGGTGMKLSGVFGRTWDFIGYFAAFWFIIICLVGIFVSWLLELDYWFNTFVGLLPAVIILWILSLFLSQFGGP